MTIQEWEDIKYYMDINIELQLTDSRDETRKEMLRDQLHQAEMPILVKLTEDK